MYTDSTELHINTEYTLLDQVNDLGEIILQCQSNASQCYEGMPEISIASIWEQVEEIEKSIMNLAQAEPGYCILPAYRDHCDIIKKIRQTLLKYEKSKEEKVKDADDPISATKIEELLHARLLGEGFHPQKSSDPFAFIASLSPSPKLAGFVQAFYLSLPPEGKSFFVEQLVPKYIIMHPSVSQNFTFFNPLIKADKQKGDDWTIVSLAKGLNENPSHLSQKFKVLSEEKSIYKQDLLMEFIGFGNVTQLGGLLTCAQLASRKSYPINATVLKEPELADYFKLFQQATTKNMTEHFVVASAHWLSGIIEKLPNGQVRLLVIDVLGSADTRQYSKPVIDEFFKYFPAGQVFRNNEKLQRSELGCSIFSLEHLRHFPKTAAYLNMPLMQYFAEQKIQKTPGIQESKERVKFCHLPLPLLRVMEDNALHKKIIPGRDAQERESKIIKKGKTAEQCVEHDFKFDPAVSSLRNKRIGLVKDKFFIQNQNFLSSHSDTQIKQKMHDFTLDGFRQRISSLSKRKSATLERAAPVSISSASSAPQPLAYNPYRLSSGPAHQSMSDYSVKDSKKENGWGIKKSAQQNRCGNSLC